MANLPEVTEENFQSEVLDSELPVVVDFMAPWCAPCRMIAPILERKAAEYSGRIKFVQMDTDRFDALSKQYGVQKIPNLTFFKNGEVVDQLVGFLSETQIAERVEDLLKK